MDNFQTKILEGMNHTLHIDNAGGEKVNFYKEVR